MIFLSFYENCDISLDGYMQDSYVSGLFCPFLSKNIFEPAEKQNMIMLDTYL